MTDRSLYAISPPLWRESLKRAQNRLLLRAEAA
jgi:hypothetical protein